MEKKLKVNPNRQSMLSREQMQGISGGSILETVVKLALAGMEYCFNMGVREAKRMKAQL